MNRRDVVGKLGVFLISLFVSSLFGSSKKPKQFVFKIKTKSGSIISNISITATDRDAAEVKLKKRYPECQILSCKEKSNAKSRIRESC